MPHQRPPSRCSSSSQLHFHWFDGTLADKDALDRATEAFMDMLRQPNRLWNPYAEVLVKAEFRKRIEKAERGLLKPIDEVKGVDEGHLQPLYEIRWQEVPVTERESPESPPVHLQVMVRLYHSEPVSEPEYFIGHHVHQKVIGPGVDVYGQQDAEIAVARGLYDLGISVRWHLQ